MNTVLDYLIAHPMLVLGALFAALNVANALLPYASMRGGSRLKRVIGAALDALAVLARRDSPQTLTLPLIGRSLAPVVLDALATPDKPAGDERVTRPSPMMPPPLPLLLMLAALSACTATQGQQAGHGFAAVDKVMTWVCGVWPGVRTGARAVLPAPDDAGASSGGAQ